MNQRVFVLKLKLTRLSAITSPYLAECMNDNKLDTVFLHEIVIIFSPIYLSETTYVFTKSHYKLIQSKGKICKSLFQMQ